MKILVIYDGKPGHLSQAMGAAQLIQERMDMPVIIEQQVARVRLKVLNRLTRKLISIPSAIIQKLVILNYKRAKPEEAPDLIISFGGNVLALSVALRNLYNCYNLAIGNIYSVERRHLDAHISMRATGATTRGIFSPVALCKIKPMVCIEKGKELKQSLPGFQYWGMLVGGNGSGYHYSCNDWHELGQAMKELSDRHGIKWIVTTSRRSGTEAEDILKLYLDASKGFHFFEGSCPQKHSLEAILGASERLFCTEDSMSMVTESVAMDKPVVTLAPQQFTPKTTHRRAMEYLSTCGLIERVTIDRLSQMEINPYSVKKSYSAHLDTIFGQLMDILSLSNHEHAGIARFQCR